MLHTKFRGNRSTSSGEEDFWRVFTIYGCGGHLGHVTQMLRTNFRSPYPRRLHIKFGFDRPSGFREDDVWKCGRRRTTAEGRRSMGILKAHLWAFCSGELTSLCSTYTEIVNNWKHVNFRWKKLIFGWNIDCGYTFELPPCCVHPVTKLYQRYPTSTTCIYNLWLVRISISHVFPYNNSGHELPWEADKMMYNYVITYVLMITW